MRALSFYRTMKSVFAWLPLLVCLPLRTFGSGVKATEKVETGYLLSCISTCGAAVGGRPALVWVKPSREVFFPPFAMGGCTRQGGGRGSSEKLFSSLLYVAGAADGARQDNGSDSRTKTSFVRVRARATALLERCRSVLALSRRQQRRHHKTSKR